jgi:hypothetical protein
MRERALAVAEESRVEQHALGDRMLEVGYGDDAGESEILISTAGITGPAATPSVQTKVGKALAQSSSGRDNTGVEPVVEWLCTSSRETRRST